MKYLKKYQELNEGLFYSRPEEERIIIDFICDIIDKIIEGEIDLKSDITIYESLEESNIIIYDVGKYDLRKNQFYLKVDKLNAKNMQININIKGTFFDNINNPLKNPLDPYGEENWEDEMLDSEDFIVKELRMRSSNKLYNKVKKLRISKIKMEEEIKKRKKIKEKEEDAKKIKDAADILKKIKRFEQYSDYETL